LDGSLEAELHANGAGNPNEIAAWVPGEVNVTSAGLVDRCDKIANLGDKYSCGAVWGLPAGEPGRAAPHPFNWRFGPGRHLVVQFADQFPVDTGQMDDPAVGSYGTNWTWEIEFPECWGWSRGNTNVAGYGVNLHGWAGKGCGFGSVHDVGGGTGETDLYFEASPYVMYDPTTALRVYTIDLADNASGTLTETDYINGVRVGSVSYAHFNTALGKLALVNDLRLNKACGCDTRGFPASGNAFTVRYIAVYEPKSANYAGTNGPIVESGTYVQ
jgi:hypothetical protein